MEIFVGERTENINSCKILWRFRQDRLTASPYRMNESASQSELYFFNVAWIKSVNDTKTNSHLYQQSISYCGCLCCFFNTQLLLFSLLDLLTGPQQKQNLFGSTQKSKHFHSISLLGYTLTPFWTFWLTLLFFKQEYSQVLQKRVESKLLLKLILLDHPCSRFVPHASKIEKIWTILRF